MTEFIPPQSPESAKSPITPESTQECLILLGSVDDQINEWYRVAGSKHPSLSRQSLADIIVRDCTIIDDAGHTDADIPRLGQDGFEKYNQQRRADRMHRLAAYLNDPKLSATTVLNDVYADYFGELRQASGEETYQAALEYLIRTFVLREQVGNKTGNRNFNPHFIGRVFAQLAAENTPTGA